MRKITIQGYPNPCHIDSIDLVAGSDCSGKGFHIDVDIDILAQVFLYNGRIDPISRPANGTTLCR